LFLEVRSFDHCSVLRAPLPLILFSLFLSWDAPQVVNARQTPIVACELMPEPVVALLRRCCSYAPGDRPTAAQVSGREKRKD
jgi:serine/threonine protein kinase